MNETVQSTGLVFNIQRFSIHDGPGIRTTVFFQGCNLRCFWCHNPESNSMTPVVQFYPNKCILCYRCVELCDQGAHVNRDGLHLYQRDLCQACGKCIEDCYARALVMAAKRMSVGEVFDEVMKDRMYYEDSHGGVTFSGGEPLLQKDFLYELLQLHRQAGVNTAVDTAGNVPWEWIELILPATDLILFDVKTFDDEKHIRATGVSNRRILENLSRLAARETPVWVRVPVIPGVNDDPEEIQKIAQFLSGNRAVKLVELLPFHHLGSGKYESLGRDYPSRGIQLPPDELMARLVSIVQSNGLSVRKMA